MAGLKLNISLLYPRKIERFFVSLKPQGYEALKQILIKA
jgi:hypothetical protein